MMNRLALLAALAPLIGVAPARAAAPTVPHAAASPTVTHAAGPLTRVNLQTAFAADTLAQARYLSFAAKADQEGYPRVARIFRAAARSELARARNHAETLRHLGGEATTPPPAPVTVNGTRQNLLDTLAHENAERLGSYPRLVQQARAEGQPEAVLSFTLAHLAEAGLVRLYQEALADFGGMRAPGEVIHVCRTCGHVEREGAPARCRVCLADGDAFEPVS